MLISSSNNYPESSRVNSSVITESRNKVDSKFIPISVRLGAYIFVASLPWDAIGVVKDFSLTNLTGILFALLYIVFARPNFRNMPDSIVYFLVFFAYSIGHTLMFFSWTPDYIISLFRSSAFTYFQLAVLVLLIYDLTKNKQILKTCVSVYLISYFVSSIIVEFNVMGMRDLWNYSGRISMNNQDLNTTARELAILIVLIFSILDKNGFRFTFKNIMLMVIVVILLINMFNTGSRGGLITLVFGILAVVILNFRLNFVIRYILIIPAFIILIFNSVVSNEVFMRRINDSLYAGDTGNRLELASRGWKMFLEKPIFGWGFDLYSYYTNLKRPNLLGQEVIHNAFLQILLGVGIIGFILFAIGVIRAIKITINNSNNEYGFLPLIILLTNLFGALSLELAKNKIFWIVIVITLNASSFRSKSSLELYSPVNRRK